MNTTTDENGPNGEMEQRIVRDEKGRFAPGTSPGPGNPMVHQVYEWRKQLAECVKPSDIREVVEVLVREAKSGEQWAVTELLNRCLGKPQTSITVETEDGPRYRIVTGIDEDWI